MLTLRSGVNVRVLYRGISTIRIPKVNQEWLQVVPISSVTITEACLTPLPSSDDLWHCSAGVKTLCSQLHGPNPDAHAGTR